MECESGEALYAGRVAGLVLSVLVFVAIWVIVTIRPFVLLVQEPLGTPARERAPSALGKQLLVLQERLKATAPQVGTVTGIVKILFGFMQVSSCFLATYAVPWPTDVAQFFQYSAVVMADIFPVPSIACLTSEWDKVAKLLFYTVTPPVLILLLALPVLLARAMYCGLARLRSQQFRSLEAGFYNAFLAFLFVLYPIISISVLDIYNCVRIGSASWLASDLREVCPLFEQRQFLFVWTVIATLLFPVGIPLLMLWSLYQFKVPCMSRQKTEAEALSGMLAKFQEDHKAAVWKEHGVDCTTCALVFGVLEHRQCMPDMASAQDFARAMLDEFHRVGPEYYTARFADDCTGVFDHFDADRDGRLSQQEFACLACAFRSSRTDDLFPLEIRTLLGHAWEGAAARRGSVAAPGKLRGPHWLARLFPAQPLSGRDRLVRHCLYLQEEEILTVGKVAWDSHDLAPELERTAISCMGFLFVDYKVERWYFEIVEQLRKLMMTSVVVFLFPGSLYQLTAGIAVTFLGLVLCLTLKPYLRPRHNELQAACLSIQLVTLLYGVVLLANNPDNTGPIAPNGLSTIVLLLNISVLLIPVLQYLVLRRPPRGSRSVLERLTEAVVGKVGRRASATSHTGTRSARNSLNVGDLVSVDIARAAPCEDELIMAGSA